MANLRVDKITSTETFETTGSVQFDGSGDYLSSSTIISGTGFGINDFTVDFWIYPANANSGNYTGILNLKSSTTSDRFQVAYHSSNIQVYTDTGSWRDTGFAPDISSWTHISFVRNYSSNTLKMYANGVEKWSVSNNHDYNEVFDEVWVGRHSGQSTYLNGFISNIRIVNGTALYTSNFKPSMRELEVIPGTVLLACQSKTDATLEKTGKTLTVGGNAVASELTPGILTPIVKSGGGSAITGSVEFNGVTDYLSLANSSDLRLNTTSENFTIECWVNPSSSGTAYIVGLYNFPDTRRSWQLYLSNTEPRFIYSTNGTATTSITGSSIGDNEWSHVAVVKNSSTISLYQNGVKVNEDSSTTFLNVTEDDIRIGADWGSPVGRHVKAFISNLRIVKGTALYTDDFIPPTRELKRVPGTVLLCCQDPNNPLTEVTGKTITGYGDLQRTDGSELVTNGDFSNGTTGWTISDAGEGSMAVVSGQLVVTNDDTSDPPVYAWQEITTVAGNRYRVKFQLAGGTASSHAIYLNTSSSFGDAYGQRATSGTNALTVGALGELEFVAAGTTAYILLRVNANAAATSIFDNISAYAIPHDADAPASNFTPQVGDDRKVTFEGVTKINTDAYFYFPTGDTASRTLNSPGSRGGGRGVLSGGYDGSGRVDSIFYITIQSTGNSKDFGDLTQTNSLAGSSASSTRALISGGFNPSASPSTAVNTIDFVTIQSMGNAFDFGDLTRNSRSGNSCSSSTRGLHGGGITPAMSDIIDFVTIANTGNATDFGNLSDTRTNLACTSSPTRGVFAGGQEPTSVNTIEYVTIASTGDAINFGDQSATRPQSQGLSSTIRGVFAGGEIPSNTVDTIDYITFSSTGNALDFGNLVTKREMQGSGASDSIRGVFIGGRVPGTEYDTMEYITISSTGNTTDFGDLTSTRSQIACTSDSHGGLG